MCARCSTQVQLPCGCAAHLYCKLARLRGRMPAGLCHQATTLDSTAGQQIEPAYLTCASLLLLLTVCRRCFIRALQAPSMH